MPADQCDAVPLELEMEHDEQNEIINLENVHSNLKRDGAPDSELAKARANLVDRTGALIHKLQNARNKLSDKQQDESFGLELRIEWLKSRGWVTN